MTFDWSSSVMRFDQRFCARAVVTAGLVATIVSGFGLSPVHAQTSAATPPAQGPVRRMSIDDAVATAIEQNLNLQVQRFNPQIQDASTAQFKAAYTADLHLDPRVGRSDASHRRACCRVTRAS